MNIFSLFPLRLCPREIPRSSPGSPWNTPFVPPLLLGSTPSKSLTLLKLQHLFKSYGDFYGWVNFVYWCSCIGQNLHLQPRSGRFTYTSNYHLTTLHLQILFTKPAPLRTASQSRTIRNHFLIMLLKESLANYAHLCTIFLSFISSYNIPAKSEL